MLYSRSALYSAQVRLICSHLWASTPQYQLDTFDRIQRRAIRIVEDPMIFAGFDTLALRWRYILVVGSQPHLSWRVFIFMGTV